MSKDQKMIPQHGEMFQRGSLSVGGGDTDTKSREHHAVPLWASSSHGLTCRTGERQQREGHRGRQGAGGSSSEASPISGF